MKTFLISYSLKEGTETQRRQEMEAFIAALQADPTLKGRIGYRCMKAKDGAAYYHLATTFDEGANAELQSKDFFKRYSEQTKRCAGGTVTVTPLEIVAETMP